MPAQEHLIGQFTDCCQESINIPLSALAHDDAIGRIRANELRAEPNSDLMRFWNDMCGCYEDNFLLHFSQKPWYTAYEVRAVQFRPFVYDAMNRRVPVTIEPITPQDAATTTKEPRWQTDWTSEYISKGKFDVYGLKTQVGELVALGAYEISEDVVTVHIVYMESRAQSNPTLCGRPKYHGIGRALIAYGIKLSVDAGFNERRRDLGRKNAGVGKALRTGFWSIADPRTRKRCGSAVFDLRRGCQRHFCILFGGGLTMEDAKWYFTHETEEDRLWYRTFFAMCRKFGVSWSKASEEQKAFIEEITRINYEREMAKRNMTTKPVRGFFDAEFSA